MDLVVAGEGNDDRRWDMDGVIPLPQRVPAGGARPPCAGNSFLLQIYGWPPTHGKTTGLKKAA